MSKRIKFQFLTTGMHTLLVDDSAVGYQKFGLPLGGPMDEMAARAANKLVGNKADESLFEITIIGPSILFEDDCQIALTGADISATLNNYKVGMYQIIKVQKGDVLKFGKLIYGCRAYLAIRGKWIKPTDMVVERDRLKQLNSIAIEVIEPLKIKRAIKKPEAISNHLSVTVIKGPEYELLSEEVRGSLEHTSFKLLPDSNRMGYRLSPKLPIIGQSIISSGLVPGTLQITENGTPILLMKDGPATGGYLRALVVTKKDVSKLGQLKPGDQLKFKISSI